MPFSLPTQFFFYKLAFRPVIL